MLREVEDPDVSMSTIAHPFSWTGSLLLLLVGRVRLVAPLPRHGLRAVGLLNNKCAINVIPCCYRSSHGSHGAMVGLGLALDSSLYLLGFGGVGQCGLVHRCAQCPSLWSASRGRSLPVLGRVGGETRRPSALQQRLGRQPPPWASSVWWALAVQ